MPSAWNKLIEDGDDILIELLSDKAEDLCGYRPDADFILSFLNNQLAIEEPIRINTPTANIANAFNAADESKSTPYRFRFLGREHKAKNLKQMLIQAIREFAKHDSRFLERYNALPRHGRTRRFIAKQKEDLYPGRPDLANECSELCYLYAKETNFELRKSLS